MDPLPHFEEAHKKRRKRTSKGGSRRDQAARRPRGIWFAVAALAAMSLFAAFLVGRAYAPTGVATDRVAGNAPPSEPALVTGATGGIDSPERRKAVIEFDAGMTALAAGNPDAAQTAFRKALETDPSFPGIFYQLARIGHRRSEPLEAMQNLNRSVARGESVSKSLMLKATLLGEQNQRSAAYTSFSQAAQADPASPDVYFAWGELLRSDGLTKEALEKLRMAATLATLEAEEFAIRLKLQLAMAEASEGGEELDRQLAEPNAGPELWFGAAARALSDGNTDLAKSRFQTARAAMNESFYRWAIADPFFAPYRDKPDLADIFKSPRPPTAPTAPAPATPESKQ